MDSSEFKAWRVRLALSITATAAVLGISPSQVCRYQNGSRTIPKRAVLQCSMIERLTETPGTDTAR